MWCGGSDRQSRHPEQISVEQDQHVIKLLSWRTHIKITNRNWQQTCVRANNPKNLERQKFRFKFEIFINVFRALGKLYKTDNKILII